MKSINNVRVLSEERAAGVLGVKTKTLQAWRYEGKGPKHLEPRPRVIRYFEADVLEWLKSNRQIQEEVSNEEPLI